MSVQILIQKARVHAGGLSQWARSLPLKMRSTALDHQDQSPTQEMIVRERQEELLMFYEGYESLVELLCDAAQYGPNSKQETKFSNLRQILMKQYPVMKRYVLAFLDVQVSDVRANLDRFGEATDAFEALWASPTLESQINSDDGLMIERITRTRQALEKYAEQLRQLAIAA